MRAAAAVLCLLCAAACAGEASPAAVRFPLRGQLLAVQLDTGQLLVKHEVIPGYMDAMTMPFTMADRRAIRDRRPGELITATLVVAPDRAYLENLQVIGRAPLGADAPARPVAEGVHILAPGDVPPDTPLTSHRAATVRLAEWQGQAVVVTFIYTRCPLPDYCPLLDRRFGALQAAAAKDPGLRGRVQLLSVSFDPDADTPAALAAHAARAGAGPDWHFAVASREAVDGFAAAFGVNVIREADTTITHNLRTAVIAPDGRVAVLRSGTDWTPDEVLDDLRRALGAAASR